jgi:hypothetical protein
VQWLLSGPDGCSWKVAGFWLRVAGFSPFFSDGRIDRAVTDVVSLNRLLASHFEPLALEELVVVRRDFPNWMRPDLHKALVALLAEPARTRFVGARIRDRDFDFRFSDLAEAGRVSGR